MIMEGGALFFEKENLQTVRGFYPCIHSRDFYGAGASCLDPCCGGRHPDNNSRLHLDTYVNLNPGGIIMKVVIMKLPKFLSGITKAVFRIK